MGGEIWTFIHSCARGALPGAECAPVFETAGFFFLFIVAILVLTALVKRRLRQEQGSFMAHTARADDSGLRRLRGGI